MKFRVETLLEKKGHQVVWVSPDATASAAVMKMLSERVGSVIVADGSRLRGIFTERDYLHRIVRPGRDGTCTRVADVMTTGLSCVAPRDSVQTCMTIMTRQRCRHLPVIFRGHLVGLVSIGDCVALLCEELAADNAYLTEYIRGTAA
jgi:signal-transduction protein with cAMP-binding, CBS, and nucleotidyltransferase domain